MFTWTSPAGVEISLPPLKTLKAGILRKHRTKDDIDFMFSVLEDLMDEDNLSRVDDLDMGEANDLFAAWQKDAGVGESSGSST